MGRGEVGWRRGDPQAIPPISNVDQHWDHRHGAELRSRGGDEPAQIPLSLPREAVESPSLEIFKTHLDKVLCSLL